MANVEDCNLIRQNNVFVVKYFDWLEIFTNNNKVFNKE